MVRGEEEEEKEEERGKRGGGKERRERIEGRETAEAGNYSTWN